MTYMPIVRTLPSDELSAACDELYRLLSCCLVELRVNKVYEKSVVICL